MLACCLFGCNSKRSKPHINSTFNEDSRQYKLAEHYVSEQRSMLSALYVLQSHKDDFDLRRFLDNYVLEDGVFKPSDKINFQYIGVSKNSNFEDKGYYYLICRYKGDLYLFSSLFHISSSKKPSIVCTKITTKQCDEIKLNSMEIRFRKKMNN